MDCIGPIVVAIMSTHYNPNGNRRRIKVIAKNVCYYSKRKRVSPYLVISTIRHESFFKPNLISGTNDYGLMQLNKKYFGHKCKSLLQIKCNIREGTKFLSALKRVYKNAKFHWLRKYNWYSFNHHLRILWLTRAYKEAKEREELYEVIRSGRYKRLKLNYQCIKDDTLCMDKR